MSHMNDDDFAHAFLHGSLPPEHFHHRDHVRLAWHLTRHLGLADATQAITGGIRGFAAQHGHAEKYHETITQFWVRIVGYLVASRPDIADFETFLATFPHLLDTHLPYRHWLRETIDSPAARARWVAPDLLALPA